MEPEQIVVVGGSAGSFDPIRALLAALPGDTPAAICVVMHTATTRAPRLAELVGARAALPVTVAEDGRPLESRRVYLAPPRRHLLVRERHLRLSSGPTENHARPSIDVLFRSAAVEFGARCSGVVLSGANDDGATGLCAIVSCGGAAFVQSPERSTHDRMPRAAIAAAPDAVAAPVEELAELVVRRLRTRAPPTEACPRHIVVENELAFHAGQDPAKLGEMPSGSEAVATCPECGGPLFVTKDPPRHFRCLIGHAFSAHTLLGAHRDGLMRALWAAERMLGERARMLHGLVERGQPAGAGQRADEYAAYARSLRALLESLVDDAGEDDRLLAPASDPSKS